jgi:uncharacterized delta-60 repeat protein
MGFFSRKNRAATSGPSPSRTRGLHLEVLEERSTPTAGVLDPTFGGGTGYISLPAESSSSGFNPLGRVIAMADGGIISLVAQGNDFGPGKIRRFDAQGTLQWTTDPVGGFFEAAALDDAGHIIVTGGTGTSPPGGEQFEPFRYAGDFAVWSINAETGAYDMTFGGGDGIATADLQWRLNNRWHNGSFMVSGPTTGSGGDYASAIAVDGMGRIVVTGGSIISDIRLEYRIFDIMSGSSGRPADPDNLTGNEELVANLNNTIQGHLTARFNSNGTLDTTFGQDLNLDGAPDGMILALGPGGSPSETTRVLVDSQNRIVTKSAGDVARYTEAGQLDASFGIVDEAAIDADFFGNPSSDSSGPMALDSAGNIVVGSITSYFTGVQIQQVSIVITRFKPDGTLDTTFGTDGKVLTALSTITTFGTGGGDHWLSELMIDRSGRIVVAGGRGSVGEWVEERSTFETHRSIVLARYLNDGAPDASFGNAGLVISNIGAANDDWVDAATLDRDGHVLIAGTSQVFDESYWPDVSTWRPDLLLARYIGNLAPTANAGGPYTALAGPTVQLDASGTTDADQPNSTLDYEWDFNGDGHIDATGMTPTYVAASPGTFTVTLRVRDNYNALGTATATIHIPDFDADGIENPVDTLPLTFSNDFSDVALGGTTTGTITKRGDQMISIVDAPNPAEGLLITAGFLGGPAPAMIQVVNGAGKFSLTSGDQLTVTQGSVIVNVLTGAVEAEFVADTGAVATASLNAGNELTFEPESFTFVAPATNTQTLEVLIDGSVLSVGPGQTVTSVQIDIKPGSDSNPANLAGNGMISVAILSAAGFDAQTVDVTSIIFAGAHAAQSSFEDVNGDGLLDLVVFFRTQDTTLRSLYEQLVADDLNEDGVLDSNHETASIALSGLCQDGTSFWGTDAMDLFLSGKALRDLLAGLAAAGAI